MRARPSRQVVAGRALAPGLPLRLVLVSRCILIRALVANRTRISVSLWPSVVFVVFLLWNILSDFRAVQTCSCNPTASHLGPLD